MPPLSGSCGRPPRLLTDRGHQGMNSEAGATVSSCVQGRPWPHSACCGCGRQYYGLSFQTVAQLQGVVTLLSAKPPVRLSDDVCSAPRVQPLFAPTLRRPITRVGGWDPHAVPSGRVRRHPTAEPAHHAPQRLVVALLHQLAYGVDDETGRRAVQDVNAGRPHPALRDRARAMVGACAFKAARRPHPPQSAIAP